MIQKAYTLYRWSQLLLGTLSFTKCFAVLSRTLSRLIKRLAIYPDISIHGALYILASVARSPEMSQVFDHDHLLGMSQLTQDFPVSTALPGGLLSPKMLSRLAPCSRAWGRSALPSLCAHQAPGCSHLDDVIPSVLAVQRFHCADVKSSKNLRARVYPQLVPAKTRGGTGCHCSARGTRCHPPSSPLLTCVRASHLSDMAICSSIAEPVLVFQFPDTDVLLVGEGGET